MLPKEKQDVLTGEYASECTTAWHAKLAALTAREVPEVQAMTIIEEGIVRAYRIFSDEVAKKRRDQTRAMVAQRATQQRAQK